MKFANISLILLFSLTSCLAAAKGMEDPVTGSRFDLILLQESLDADEALLKQLEPFLGDLDRASLAKLGCEAPGLGLANPILVPLVSAIGARLYDKYQNAKLKKLEQLKKDSRNEYSTTAYLTSTQLKDVKCAILLRYVESGDEINPGLVAIIRFDHKLNAASEPKAFTIKPVHLDLKNATVKTLSPKKHDQVAMIDIGIGLSLKAAIDDQTKPSAGILTTASSVGIDNVKFNSKDRCKLEVKENAKEVGGCKESDLLPHYSADTVVSLTFSVAEVGHVGIDFDTRKAEIEALKEAYGPAISDAITEALSEE